MVKSSATLVDEMSTTVDEITLPGSDGPLEEGPKITAHARVRFLERYVDDAAVRAVRESAANDRQILELLEPKYPRELAAYEGRVSNALAHLTGRLGTLPFPRYGVRIGALRVAMVGDTCVTTLPSEPPRRLTPKHRSRKCRRRN
jgi:hypothetical protein